MRTKDLDRYFPELAEFSDSEKTEIYDGARHDVMVGQKMAGAWVGESVLRAIGALILLVVCYFGAIWVFGSGMSNLGPLMGVPIGLAFGKLHRYRYASLIRASVDRGIRAKAN